MVDKIEKYGKKRIYYPLRTVAFVLLAALAIGTIIVIPLGISVRLSAEVGKASEILLSLL